MMGGATKNRIAPGESLCADLTVLDIIDDGGAEPIYLVWSSREWCHMACKVMRTARAAQREFRVLSALAHPNILRALELRDQIHLLTPFLEGTSLSDAIDGAPKATLPVSDVMRLAIQIGAALIHMHGRGYLHMDVKPDNIIIGSDGRPVLFDFGSARRISAKRPGKVVGTNAYVAPEECRLLQAGPEADVFSLAVTIYEMLAGETPFGQSSRETPFPQLSNDLQRLRKLRPRAPLALEELLADCLAREPSRRPTLPQLLPTLHRFISSGPSALPREAEETLEKIKRPRGRVRGGRSCAVAPGLAA